MGNAGCDACVHVRAGKSVVQAAHLNALARFKPPLVALRTRQLQEEVQKVGGFLTDVASAAATKIDQFSGRPPAPGIRYCGVDEFSGIFYITEVKNETGECPQFTPAAGGPATHACTTCVHLRQPLRNVVSALEQVLQGHGDKSQKMLEQELTPMLQANAESEVTDCVDGAGIMPRPPAFLPLCRAHSSSDEGRFVVGPVVNVSSRCTRWEQGANANDDQPELRALQARMRQIVGEWESSLSRAASLDWATSGMQNAADAEAAVIDYCLSALGADRDFVTSFCGRYTETLWGKTWSAQAPQMPATAPAEQTPAPQPAAQPFTPTHTMQPSSPAAPAQGPIQPVSFAVVPNMTYAHPSRPGFALTVLVYPMQTVALVQAAGRTYQFDLAQSVPGAWTQLQTPEGPLPIALMPQLPFALFATWM
jgi:hypothetical protein